MGFLFQFLAIGCQSSRERRAVVELWTDWQWLQPSDLGLVQGPKCINSRKAPSRVLEVLGNGRAAL